MEFLDVPGNFPYDPRGVERRLTVAGLAPAGKEATVKRFMVGAALFAAAWAAPAVARAECSTVVASTPSGTTFPCTVCIEGGRVVSIFCTPPVTPR